MAPTALASATKQNLRRAVAARIYGSAFPFLGSATSAGNVGGTTLPDTNLIGYGDRRFNQWFVLLTSGTYSGQWRRVTGFTTVDGTLTLVNGVGGQIANAVTYELHRFPPPGFTTACNQALADAYPAVYRMVNGHVLAASGINVYGTPRGIVDIVRLRCDTNGSEIVDDKFTAANSTTSAGSNYTAVAGTWGISSNQLYSVTDADANLLTSTLVSNALTNSATGNLLMQARISGTLNSGVTYRSPALVFRYLLNTTDYLVVRLLNGQVQLRKVDGGVESSLATATQTTTDGTDYILKVVAEGNWIKVWVDDLQLIEYELTGTNVKYLGYTGAGVRLDKAGAPATAARWDNLRVHHLKVPMNLHDWEQSEDRRSFRLGALGGRPGIPTDYLIYVDGRAQLTALADDSTYGTIASDTTATLEIATTDPAWNILVDHAAAALYEQMSQSAGGMDPTDRAEFTAGMQKMLAAANAGRVRNRMPRPPFVARYPN